jgi:hypothetical protein
VSTTRAQSDSGPLPAPPAGARGRSGGFAPGGLSTRRSGARRIEAERRADYDLHERGIIDDAILRRIERDLGFEDLRMEAQG